MRMCNALPQLLFKKDSSLSSRAVPGFQDHISLLQHQLFYLNTYLTYSINQYVIASADIRDG